MSQRIFMIEDNQEIIDLVSVFLREEGFIVDSEVDSAAGLAKVEKNPPDLVLLDIRMKGMDGLQVCEALKRNGRTRDVPVVMVSARSREADVILGLERGADDYIRKPIQLGELLARVKTVLRRRQPSPPSDHVEIGPLRIDASTFTATINRQPLQLRPKEFELLKYLAEHEGRVVTRASLSQHVWDRDHVPTSHTIEYHVYELRKKLGGHGHWVQSLKGVGYRFEVSD